MSNFLTPEEVFGEIKQGIEPYPWESDQYGINSWKCELIGVELVQANQILRRHGMEPTDRVRFGRQSEFMELKTPNGTVPAEETVDIILHYDQITRKYNLTRSSDSPVVSLSKDIRVDGDIDDLRARLQSAILGVDVMGELGELAHEMHEVDSSELVVLSALTKILASRNSKPKGNEKQD